MRRQSLQPQMTDPSVLRPRLPFDRTDFETALCYLEVSMTDTSRVSHWDLRVLGHVWKTCELFDPVTIC